jgi:hypothetical protein
MNFPDFLMFRLRATYSWRALDKGYNFALDLTSIGGLHEKLWVSKITGVPILRISRLPLGSPGTKWHLGVGPMARHKGHYKGEGDGVPQVQAVVNLVSSCLPMVISCTKNVPTMHKPTCCLVCAGPCEWLTCLLIFLVPKLESKLFSGPTQN